DNAIDALASDDFIQFGCQSNYAWVDQAVAAQFRIAANETCDAIACIGTFKHLARDFDGKSTGAHNQNLFAEVRMTQQPMNGYSPANHQSQGQSQCNEGNAAAQHE